MSYLCDIDTDVAAAYELIGPPAPRIREPGFESFVAAIVSQQVSKEAAATIFSRVKALVPKFTANAVLELEFDDLRGAGLSKRKVEYTQGLAEAIVEGRFDVDALVDMTDAQAIDSITQLRGFGRWSAEIYMMFALARKDLFPADDLALQMAITKLKGLQEKVKPSHARQLTETWAPWRSVGSLFLWHYYRGAPQ